MGALYRENPYIEEGSLIIERGTSVKQISTLICNEGLFFNDKLLTLIIFLQGKANKLQCGEYAIEAGESAVHFLDKLSKGKVIVHSLTIPSGLTNHQIADKLIQENRLNGSITASADSYLFPDTYQYTYGMQKEAMWKIMKDKGSQTLNALWEENKHNSFLTSIKEVLILASIVEKETNKAEELPRVAAVFINRLKSTMKLQADPTVVYAVTEGKGSLKRKLTKEDLKTPNLYNTYYVGGLPPGPICNPGLAALRAVIFPLKTRELYFVADGKGGHLFANSLKEHNNNVNNVYKK